MSELKRQTLSTELAAKAALLYFRATSKRVKPQQAGSDQGAFGARLIRCDPHAPFVKNPSKVRSLYLKKDETPLDKLDKATSMAELFSMAVEMYGEHECLGYRPILGVSDEKQADGRVFQKLRLGPYEWLSFKALDEMINNLCKAFQELGVCARQNVVLLADTRYEWMVVAQALMRSNLPVVTLYANLSDEGIIHGITETESRMVITTREILERMAPELAKLEKVDTVVFMESPSVTEKFDAGRLNGKMVLSLTQVLDIGENSVGPQMVAAPTGDDIAILMYTSGSTGVPKAVRLLHRNILASAKGLAEVFDSIKVTRNDSYIAYLPLAHVFELCSETLAMLYGVKIGYSSVLTLTDNSTGIPLGGTGDAPLLQPTIMVAVPLVLDRVKKGILEKAAARGPLAVRVLELAVRDITRRLDHGQDVGGLYESIFGKIRSVVGGRVRFMASGSAPLSPETHSFIRAALGCTVVQGYGLTETCAAATCMNTTDFSTGEVGGPVSGAFIQLADWEEGGYRASEGKGEVVVGGEMIADGYFKNPALTEESFFEKDGVRWFRTGDIAQVDERGSFKIIDRKKDLVKLQHGEYVSLGKVETEYKTLPVVDNICVFGSGLQTYLVALVAPSPKVLKDIATELGKPAQDLQALCDDPDVNRAVLNSIQNIGRAKKFLRVEIPQRIKLCPQEWTPDTGLVTAAFKIRRKQVQERFQKDIDLMYSP